MHISKDLLSCTYVFIRRDAVKNPLQQLYDSSYKVLKRSNKYYTVELNGRQDTVSVDRLKPAHCDTSSTTTTEAHAPTPPSAPPFSTAITRSTDNACRMTGTLASTPGRLHSLTSSLEGEYCSGSSNCDL